MARVSGQLSRPMSTRHTLHVIDAFAEDLADLEAHLRGHGTGGETTEQTKSAADQLRWLHTQTNL